jgi:hypothetical protein
VPGDIDGCLVCGADIRDDVLVSTVTVGPQPPAPPDHAALIRQDLAATGAPAAWPAPETAGLPRFTGPQEVSRWLAAGGQGLVAIVYAIAALDAVLVLGSAGGAWALVSLGFSVLLAWFYVRNALKLVSQPDMAVIRSAIALSFIALVLFGAEALDSNGDPLAIAIALTPGIACALAVVARQLLLGSIPERAASTA